MATVNLYDTLIIGANLNTLVVSVFAAILAIGLIPAVFMGYRLFCRSIGKVPQL